MSQKTPKSPKSLEIVGQSKSPAAAKLEDIDIEQLTAISLPIKKRINALKNDQLKLLDLEKQFFEELHQLECKYAKLYEPIYEKRKKIVVGETEPTEEEAKWDLDEKDKEEEDENKAVNGEKAEKDEKAKIDESKLTDSGKKLLSDLKSQFEKKLSDEKGVPNFWLETLQALRVTSEMIEEHDEPILAFLQDIRVRMHEQKPYGYTLEFEFGENPYFSNKVLTKTYELKIETDPADPFSFDGPELKRCYGCKIDWKPNKNVTVRLIKKKIKGRNKKAPPKIITKEESQQSFFSFFETRPDVPATKTAGQKGKGRNASESSEGKLVAVKSNKHPDDDENDEDEDDMDEETAHDLYLMTEFETGQYIKDKLIPKAALYFSGELDDMDDEEEYDYQDEYDEDDDDEDDDEDDEEDDDDDDDDNEDEQPNGSKKPAAGGKGGKKGGKPGAGHKGEGSGKPGEPTPSECKQN